MEIAESLLQPLVTMMRRGGRFRRGLYAVHPFEPSENRSDLDIWTNWSRLESYKRLIFRILQHDSHVSITLSVTPLLSYAEIQLPFPDSRAVWMAPDPETWKSLYLESSIERKPSLGDYMNDIGCIGPLQAIIDCHVASMAFLAGAWRLIWEYNQFSSLQRGHTQHLLTKFRFEELSKLLLRFRITIDSQLQSSPDIGIQLELNLMHLNMSLDEVLLFTGVEGPEEARQVVESLTEWVESSNARQAIWHAGQVLRTARICAAGSLNLFPALALYHASIAFWAYGLLIRDTTSGTIPRPVVEIDASETLDVQRFIQLGHGSPAIRSLNNMGDLVSSQILLTEPYRIMEAMIEVLTHNSGTERPVLVKNLIRLMKELQSAANSTS
jgi:Fungal specific transcription factor domain